ncbi:MAG TPA: ribonuclease E activity regulator RraA [Acidimicrobiales bacterium]|jgi:regulator of ribonuclease activity A|nr:ribonuclease E activity regulator RraA [Acidimicrobiales bacterium]|tara:strand:+ start:4583 stop:5065 length:483 start_codon:yes stop_codon:yes gene_type:complete
MDLFATADLLDVFPEAEVLPLRFFSYGQRTKFYGETVTVIAPEDNTLVRQTLESEGHGKVLVVDGEGSLNCALLGDRLAALAIENNWHGVIINGCIRDSAVIQDMPIGIKAIGTNPRKSVKRGLGEVGTKMQIADIDINTGSWIYADSDGVIIAKKNLLA